jgi:hypothetical protein
MRHRILAGAAAGAALVLSTTPAAGIESAEPISNWQAPPYWQPAPEGDGSREATATHPAQGRRALTGGTTALPFVALFPCRLVDTRGNAPLTGGFLPPATLRSYTLTGVCNVPANAKAISLNATVVHPTGPGFLTLYPEGGAFPPVSTLNYLGNDVVVNAAVVPLSAAGGISMALGVSGGDVILDTNGYYTDAADVASVNGLTGEVTLSAGANVTLTPSGNTLTIASSAGSGPPSGAAGGSLSGTYPNPGIAAGAVGSSQIAAGAVGTGQLADGSVTDAKVASLSFGKVTGVPGYVLKAGDVMTGTLHLNPGNIELGLVESTSTSGSIVKNGQPFLHDFGDSNIFVGRRAGNFTMTGSGNTALGQDALETNTNGQENTAVGFAVLTSNLGGYHNTGVGYSALVNSKTGNDNTAVGTWAMSGNQTGNSNTGIGRSALESSKADSNTAVGYEALGSVNTGFQNSALGANAGTRSGAGTAYSGGGITYAPVTGGSYNTFVGYGTGTTSATVLNCTAVGIDAYCDGDNQVRLGNPFVASIGGKVAWSALSDARAKDDVRELRLGLDFVLRLRPVSYRLKGGNGRTDMGFLAQDVEGLLGTEFNVLTVGGDADRTLSLRYTDLIAPLVKAVQEQAETIRTQLEAIRKQDEAIRNDRRTIEELSARLARLEAHLTEVRP